MTVCEHVYKITGARVCEMCGGDTHETDWAEQHELHKKWIADGKATAQGWWSI